MRIRLISFLMLISMITVSCKKDDVVVVPTQPPPAQPMGMLFGNQEYFWGNPWQKKVNDYEINIETARLTDSALNRGIQVYVAIYSDWSLYTKIPWTLYDFSLPDTVNLSFIAIPRKLKVIAKTPFDLSWAGDVFIKYQ